VARTADHVQGIIWCSGDLFLT